MTIAALFALALPLAANEKPSDAYQKAMRDNGEGLVKIKAAVKELEDSGAGTQDYAPFIEVVGPLKASFATTLAYWQAKKVDDAITLAQDAVKAVADMEAGANDRNFRAVLASSTALGETCGACHRAHRASLPDGGYEIK
jgi:hypothetical protein